MDQEDARKDAREVPQPDAATYARRAGALAIEGGCVLGRPADPAVAELVIEAVRVRLDVAALIQGAP
jgi:hypothetical protein